MVSLHSYSSPPLSLCAPEYLGSTCHSVLNSVHPSLPLILEKMQNFQYVFCHWRNGLATFASSNCYFRCLKVGSTNQISEHSHMIAVKPNCVMHLNRRSHAHSTFNSDRSIVLVQALCATIFFFRTTFISLQQQNRQQTVASTSRKASFSWLEKLQSITCTRQLVCILQLPGCHIRIQFELAEVARPFLLRPGNEATLEHASSTYTVHPSCHAT